MRLLSLWPGNLKTVAALSLACFLFYLAVPWKAPPSGDGFRYLSAAQYVSDTGNLLGAWPKIHMGSPVLHEPRLGIWSLAFAYLVGGEAASRVLLAGIAALSVYPVFGVLSSLEGERTATLGTVLWFLWPLTFLWTSAYYIDIIAVLFGMFGLWCVVRVVGQESGAGRWAMLAAAFLALSVLSKRASIIYFFALVYAAALLTTRRANKRTAFLVTLVACAVLAFSASWSFGWARSSFREPGDVPALANLTHPGKWGAQLLGLSAQVNGFLTGNTALEWASGHPVLFSAWVACSCVLAYVAFLGLRRIGPNTRLWLGACLLAGFTQIAYMQYARGDTAMSNSLARYFLYVAPPFVLLLAKGLDDVQRTCAGGRIRWFLRLAAVASIAGIVSVGAVNVRVRAHSSAQEIELIEEAKSAIPPEGVVAARWNEAYYYLLYPREVQVLGPGGLSDLQGKNITYLLLRDDERLPEAIEAGFVSTWRKSELVDSLFGESASRITLEVYELR